MKQPPGRTPSASFPASSAKESSRIGALLRTETVGGLLLVSMAAIALVWANSPWAADYFALRDFTIGIAPLHLQLSLGDWAADGLLAVFFFLVGLELKREFVAGDLRRFGTAIVPVVAAIGGVVVPAAVFYVIALQDPKLHVGWAIPTATDIAFAVAVLALIGSHLPGPLRVFLLTLAVVDDLIAITIIAVFYTASFDFLALGIGLGVIVIFGAVAQRYATLFHLRPSAAWLILLPIGVVAWTCIHASGVHATVTGVLLGFTIPVLKRPSNDQDGPGLAEVFEHRFRPLSAGFAAPIFAFFAAGVAVGGPSGVASALSSPLGLGILAGFIIGKPLGISLATWAITRLRHIGLDPSLRWIDIIGVSMLGGVGFTVALLVTELSFAHGSAENTDAKIAVLTASIGAAALASLVLSLRNRHYRRSGASS